MSLLFVLWLALAGYGSLGASRATYGEMQTLHWGAVCRSDNSTSCKRCTKRNETIACETEADAAFKFYGLTSLKVHKLDLVHIMLLRNTKIRVSNHNHVEVVNGWHCTISMQYCFHLMRM